ncbi:hypothetical protein skT53_35170 [Effusibacillus dendaii]|uniref:GH18 domain-containing protein n=1 Tax=Effusibacillus dendaii TaxID=2743772 RepID=A0A7I8DGQ1_9BACL|nr:hypothetical protein skT53_35170 [Effusibacillus dendaii]
MISTRGYAGVNIDFEGGLPEDRDLYSDFLRFLRDRIRPRGLVLTVAVPAKTGEDIPWWRGYDFGAIGSVVDYMFLMAYDWHHLASEPGPVAPINGVRQTIEFSLEHVARNKILLGIPFHSYDWTLPYRPGSPVRAISSQQAVRLAIRHQVPIEYSEEYKSPFFYYTDEQGQRHVVWFEDVRSLMEKGLLIRQYQLGGLGTWQLALSIAQATSMLRSNVIKVT